MANELIKKISQLIDTLENDSAKEYLESANIQSLGAFMSSLEQLKAFANNPNMDISRVFNTMNESLVSLESNATKGISNAIQGIQSEIVNGFVEMGRDTSKIASDELGGMTGRLNTVITKTVKGFSIGMNNVTKVINNEVGKTLTIIND